MNKALKILVAIMGLAMLILIIDMYSPVFEKAKAGPAKKKTKQNTTSGSNISIVHKWEMPDVLKEISGIAWIDNNRFACVQDEKGIIFIYNTTSATIEKEIPFTGNGDFEDIVLVGRTAYALRSDGHIFEVSDIGIAKPAVQEYETPLTAKQNIEGLAYDKKNNRLLAVVKDKEPADDSYKGIYAFSMANKKMQPTPVYKISMNDPVLGKGKKKGHDIYPSAIAIHPSTGDIYILEGRDPRLLVMKADGSLQKLYSMSKDEFAQPEGLSFAPDGTLYISNEGVKQRGNILEVTLSK